MRRLLIVVVSVLLAVSCLDGSDRVPAVPPPVTPPEAAEWRLIFRDEFDGSGLDRSKWTTCYWWANDGCTNESSDELQWYQPDNVIAEGGRLRLRAREREVRTSDGTFDYTSGMVTTGRSQADRSRPPRFAFQYGYVEMRARVPAGQGLWSAFWLLPPTEESRPEIDVMEVLGHEPETLQVHLHTHDRDGERVSRGQALPGADLSADWHTYALDWRPDALVWLVDGEEQWRVTDPDEIPAEPMYLLANLAVGGEWPGEPDEETPFPSWYEIDYVRVWQTEQQSATSRTQ